MTDLPTLAMDLKRAENWIAQYSLTARRLVEAEVAGTYAVLQGDAHIARLVVKTLREATDEVFDEAHARGHIITWANGCSSPYQRIADLIDDAMTQFNAANPSTQLPNILVLVCHDEQIDVTDLEDTVVDDTDIEEGSLDHAKPRIGLYVWIDGTTGRTEELLFNRENSDHAASVCKMLGLESEKVRWTRKR